MNRNATLLTGIGVGAGLMYLLDPAQGRRRRALVRDQMAHALNKTGDALDATGRDLRNRVIGVTAEVRRRFAAEDPDDAVLTERIRATLGRIVSHPHAVEVVARDGRVRLSGPILSHESKPLLTAVSRVQGVAEIDNQLEEHERVDNIPALQGGVARSGRFGWMQENWSPTTRLLAGGAGGALAAYGLMKRNTVSAGAALFGVGLIARGLTNLETSRLIGVGAGRRAVDIQKAIEIGAPVEQVFDFWSSPEDFPRYTTSVIEVRPTRVQGQMHWTVRGFAGSTFEFDTIVTQRVPNEVIAWKTVDGSAVGHAGIIRFEPIGDSATGVHIRISYNPPAGAVGHGVAKAFGTDLKACLDEDLARIKTALETGRPPRDAARRQETDMPQIH